MEPAPASIPPPDPFLGAILGGRYRVLERLGEGGMGAVYRAEHLELERHVAVKMLAPELSRARTNVERFQREARTASSIGHPNIVDVFDMGRAGDGTPYLVMQLLEGHDLDEELERVGALEPSRVVELLAPVANALDACHQRGVIHRDIKPSNIFLARLGDGSVSPKLVDFGLAILAAADERLTQTGFLSGTPHYLPPEAAHGDLPGAAGDIYSLATVAYEAISGALPFDSENLNGVLVQKVTMEAPPMSAVAQGDFPDAVEAVLQKALDQDPARRHETAAAFVADLARAITDSRSEWGPDLAAPPKQRLTYQDYRQLSRAKVSAVRELEPTASPTDTAPELPRSVLRRSFPLVFSIGLVVVAALGGVAWWLSAQPPAAAVTEPAPPIVPRAAADPTPAPLEPPGIEPPPAPPEPAPAPVEAVAPEPEPIARPSRRRATDTPATGRDRPQAEDLVRQAGSMLVRGDVASAIPLLERARIADPTFPATYRTLGLAYEQSHRDAAARQAYERYLRLAPRAGDADRIRARIESL